MAVDSSNIANKDFSKLSKKIDKKLIILVLVFFLVVFAIFYYRSNITKELESLLPLPTPAPSVSTLLQKHSQVLQEAFSKADYGEISVSPPVEIPLAEVEEKFSRKGKDEATGSTYVSGYLGSIDSENNSLVIRLTETEWIKSRVEEDARIHISSPAEDQLITYELKEGLSNLKLGDWVTALCISEECHSVKKVWAYRSTKETERPLGGPKDWTEAMPLGWCPPVERCWGRLIKFRPAASNIDVLMRGIVQSIDQEKNEITLLMEGGTATVQILPEAVFSSMIDPDFLSLSQIKKGDKLIVRCAFQATNCSHVNSVAKIE